MNLSSHLVRFAASCLLLTLAACGGGGDDGAGAGAPAAGTVVGAAGGTVSGPNGAKLVIPAGALAADTSIAIEQTSAGSPALPGTFTAAGAMYALTPHGTTFAVPVTLTLPLDPATVAAGMVPRLLKTNARNEWQEVAGAGVGSADVSAQITSFSYAQVMVAQVSPVQLLRKVSFEPEGGPTETRNYGEGVLDERRLVGPSGLLDIPIDGDNTSALEAFSSADGLPFWVGSESGKGHVLLTQSQSFVAETDAPTLEIVVTAALVEALDFNGAPTSSECPFGPSLATCTLLFANASFEAELTIVSPEGEDYLYIDGETPVLDTGGFIELRGRAGLWGKHIGQPWDRTTSTFNDLQFEQTNDADGSAGQTHPRIRLLAPLVIAVDLSMLKRGDVFWINSVLSASTYGRRNVEGGGSGIGAFVRDPLRTGGAAMNFTGLTPTQATRPVVRVARRPVPCAAGPDPQAGVLQFSAPGYRVLEDRRTARDGSDIQITRTNGSKGAVSATFRVGGGSATPGVHYKPFSGIVHFADGDTAPRTVGIELLENSLPEADTTVDLTLSEAGGCATLGATASSVLTIQDDDRPPLPPPSIMIGGTVAGLAGTGLVLNKLGEHLPITANGAFTFKQAQSTGFSYSVTVITQPTNPLQLCTVTNGSGSPPTANITNIAVNCVTPAANGALDPTFGDAGRVSTALGGDNTAMVLQADRKIVMIGGSGPDFVLARYHADGSLDAGFGSAGSVSTDIAAGQDEAHGVAIQSDGKIVVVGQAVVGRTANNQFNFDFAVTRYNADGSLDTSFGSGGKVTTDFNVLADQAHAVAIQGDGKIVVVGSAGFNSPTGGGTDFAVARYNPNGTLDTSFGSGGKLTTDIGGATDIARNVVLQGNGAILVSGQLTLGSSATPGHAGLARYDANGTLDGSFGSGGKLTLANLALGEALALQADGRILVAGSAPVGPSSGFALMRLEANGSADAGFGNRGLATAAFSTQDDFGRAVAVQADGRIVVAGQSSNRSNSDFAVARFSDNGTLDSSFGTGGKLTIDFFGSFDGAENVLMQPDGKIVLGGFARNGTRTGYGLARVLP